MKSSLAAAALAASLATAVVAQAPEIPFEEFYLDNEIGRASCRERV